MQFQMVHTNLNVINLAKSEAFYTEALGMQKVKSTEASDGSYRIVFMQSPTSACQLELTWLAEHPQPYDLGDNETHIAFVAEDYEAAHALHERMGCICYENTAMGLYFIEDPDGYWLEIIPKK